MTRRAHNYVLVLEYDGSQFSGFQFQKEGVPTIQAELERAISTIVREPVRIACSGRTDAGVHATGQVAGFVISQPIPELRRFIYSVNAVLPDSIAIRQAAQVPADFHPRYSCVARDYEYLIWNGPTRPVHWRSRAVWFRQPMDLARLNQQFEAIPGHHDFGAFTRTEYRDEPTIRYVDQAKFRYLTDPISGSTDELVGFCIRGNAFLHNMIRILVGTAFDLTRGKILDDPGAILASKDRLRAGRTAPAHGLYLRAAYYRSIAGVHCLRYLDDFPDFRQKGPNSAALSDAKQPETPSGEP